MTDYERGYAAALKAAAELCKVTADLLPPGPFTGLCAETLQSAEQRILSLHIVGEADQRAKGEVYVGITLHDDKLHHLILLPGSTKAGWRSAGDWAKTRGGVLPSRHDGLVLFKHARAHFERDWYWLDEQHAAGLSGAWYQNFGWGSQRNNDLSWELRARAVRRVAVKEE